MNQKILHIIYECSQKYKPEGFIILGVFGSFARGEETAGSEVDILYNCTKTAYEKHSGWSLFALYEQIKKELEIQLEKKVNLVDKEELHERRRDYILSEVVYI